MNHKFLLGSQFHVTLASTVLSSYSNIIKSYHLIQMESNRFYLNKIIGLTKRSVT